MEREEIRSKVFQYLKERVVQIQAKPHENPQLQLGGIYGLFPPKSHQPHVEWERVQNIVGEIVQELENSGFIFEGRGGGTGSMCTYPWYTITEYGKEALLSENWLPYDPDGYLKVLREQVPELDEITLAYVGEAVGAYNRRHLLSATITLGVASENLMLQLIEAYANWISDQARKKDFEKRIEGKFISKQYKEFKKEFLQDVKSFSKDVQINWETYLDGVFNFVRFNRNDAGHPTGRQFDAKVVYANLQIFSDYAQFISGLTKDFNSTP